MRICFFGNQRLGLVRDGAVHDVTAVLDLLPRSRYPFPLHGILIERLSTLRDVFGTAATGAPSPVSKVHFSSPIGNPGKVVAAPVNYRRHLAEALADPDTFSREHVRKIQEAGLFLKATSSIIGSSQPVHIHHKGRRTDHEVELGVVIGRTCAGVSRDRALDYVAGYCIGLDITIRGPEECSLHKSLDTYTVLGPWLVTADEIDDPSELKLSLFVNGELRQHANTRDLILDVPMLIAFASFFYTLHPGDVLLTGTPEGVGPIRSGDEMHARIERIGEMRVRVERADGR